MRKQLSKIRRLFLKRQVAYQKVFDPENLFTKDVLMDLSTFCRAHETTFHNDERKHAVLEGRREVWLRIQQYLQLNLDDIYKLHNIKSED